MTERFADIFLNQQQMQIGPGFGVILPTPLAPAAL